MKDQYEEDPYFRTERDDPTDEERAESLNECLRDIAQGLALDTRNAEVYLKEARRDLVQAQDNLIDALQAEIDHMGE